MVWYKRLHWQIIIGLILGLIYGSFAAAVGWQKFTADWVAPFGTIFINLLKLIAVPLVLASLICGVASLSDLRKLSRIGGKTILIYLMTTTIAVSLGLTIVNILKPGHYVPPQMREQLQLAYEEDASSQADLARQARERGPLQPLVDIVPSNLFDSASDNRNMLQVVFMALLVGIALIQLENDKSRPLLEFFGSINEVIIRIVDIIMLMAPLGVFALIAGTITSIAEENIMQVINLLGALGYYCFAVVLGLMIQGFVTYSIILRLMTPMKLGRFFKGIAQVQLVAFSTSSSGATLPVTMEKCHEELGVSEIGRAHV